jgi:muramoyltetrapeptide carboxypeptidase LdcA involved in peptidoglycan recycling
MGLPAVYPAVYEQGLRRISEVFGLVPVEYPTTRTMDAPLQERARDVRAAFADPTVKAIVSSIGGEDQIKLLKYLDPELIGAHPKPFFDYSDNTNLHVFLWNLEIVSYHGGSVMVQFGRSRAMHPYTVASLRQALFEREEVELSPAPEYTDEELDWAESAALMRQPPDVSEQWMDLVQRRSHRRGDRLGREPRDHRLPSARR